MSDPKMIKEIMEAVSIPVRPPLSALPTCPSTTGS